MRLEHHLVGEYVRYISPYTVLYYYYHMVDLYIKVDQIQK